MRNKPHVLRIAALLGLVCAVGVGLWFWLWPQPSPPSPSTELRRSELTLKDGVLCPVAGGGPFTGIMFEQSAGGQRLSEIPVRKGIIHGVARGWHDNGQPEVEETFVGGKSHGIRTRWYPNGKKKNEATIEHGELHGPFTEWHENGQMAARLSMDHGKPNGICEAWHPDGSLKSRVLQDHGNIVTKEFFPPKTPAVVEK